MKDAWIIRKIERIIFVSAQKHYSPIVNFKGY